MVTYSAGSPVLQKLGQEGVSYVACRCPPVVTDLHLPSILSPAMPLIVCCGQGLVHVVLVVRCGASVGLSCVKPSICQRWSISELQDTFPVLSPEKLSLVGAACNYSSCVSIAY